MGQSEGGKEGGVDVLTCPSLPDATLVFPLRSEVLLLIWEGQPRHACQAHWGMDFTQRLVRFPYERKGPPSMRERALFCAGGLVAALVIP